MMKKQTVIAAGHICLDITPVFPIEKGITKPEELLVPGKLIQMESAEVHTGGSVANTGLALKLLGNEVILMGKIGRDEFGAMAEHILARYGVGGLLVDPDCSTSYSVVLAIPGIDRIFLHNPGANNTFSNADIPDGALEDAILFHFGYPPLMKRMYEYEGKELAAVFARMKSKGIATSLDLAAVDPGSEAGRVNWPALLARVLPYVDFFVPSFEELCFMLDREKYDRLSEPGGDLTGRLDITRDVEPLAEKLLGMGCRVVLIKCGTAGMYYRTGDVAGVGEWLTLDHTTWTDTAGFQPCFQAECVRSAAGAGDASIAAFLTAVLRGKTPAKCAALAAAEGACAVTSFDALGGLKSLEELEARIAAGWAYNKIR